MKKHYMKLLVVASCLFMSSVAVAVEKKEAAKPVAPAAAPAAEQKPAVAKAELLDINTATEEQLKSVPGIGDAYAKKIMAGRPYAKKDQLKSKKIVPDAVYDKIKEKIIAKQAKK
jgi:competence protein ComEA